MDTTVVPALASMQVVIDGVPLTPISAVWANPTALTIGWVGIPLATGVWNLLVQDPNLRSAGGTFARLPQTQSFHP